jgi:hypothetical protein
MPTFSEHQELDMSISVQEFYEEMDEFEIQEMVELLENGGYVLNSTGGYGIQATEFEDAIQKLIKNYHSLTNTDVEIITTLAKRF